MAFGLMGMATALNTEQCESCGGTEHGKGAYEMGWRDAMKSLGHGDE